MQTSINVRKRLAFVFFILALGLITILLRLAWLQFVRGGELQQKALENRLNVMPVAAQRGVIYDRNRHELAISIATDYIGAFPPEIKDSGKAEKIAAQLGAILNIPADKILEKITRNTGFEFVDRQVEFDKAQKIKDLKLPGIEVVPENRRYYPNGLLAAHVLGFAGIDNQGLEGLEAMYDKELAGEPGRIVLEFDALGHEIPRATHRYIPPQNGHSLVLTIDQTIQYIAERELDKIMASPTSPRKANIIVMDPKTGEILAMASRPAFDPNNFSKYPNNLWGNPLVRDAYEPGSAFKIITAAAALEEGVVKPGDRFYDPGYIKIGPDTINCWLPGGHGSESFTEGVKNSCNPVFVQVALRLEEKKAGLFYDYIKAFGFGEPTGIDLTGEGTGLLIPENELKPINIATIGIGQGIAVTPIQLITAVAAVANGGQLIRPHLVKEILDNKGKVIKKFEPEVVRRVISPATARMLGEMLEGVVSEGTGRNAYIPGYRVGGKTGTAQKAGPGGYMEGKYVASFIGIAPVNDPRLVALVTIDEPKGYPYYGGTVAAPIFQRVVTDALHYLKVPPQYDSQQKDQEKPPAPVTVPNVVGRDLAAARAELEKAGLAVRVEGSGGQVIAQVPKGGAVVPAGTHVILYLQGDPGKPRVPDVAGLRVSEAAEILEVYGLGLVPEGTGQAAGQDPAPGTVVSPGTKVKVKFIEPSLEVLGP
ncbi:Stage V sporulation protein D [Neomoorella glycerini]|uniref:Stage V sporulation protein D n=1 Tax=Neomoorella glycerini TaxID=55779 RepID=A0A6I5ZT98_9FIRM|nr:Stage V sporulation protein D [Moorella glycerini]